MRKHGRTVLNYRMSIPIGSSCVKNNPISAGIGGESALLINSYVVDILVSTSLKLRGSRPSYSHRDVLQNTLR